MVDDLIDFPCSSGWAAFYAARGLTRPVPAAWRDADAHRQLSDREFLRYMAAKEQGKVHSVEEWLAAQKVELVPRDTGEHSPLWTDLLWPTDEDKQAIQTHLAAALDKKAGAAKRPQLKVRRPDLL